MVTILYHFHPCLSFIAVTLSIVSNNPLSNIRLLLSVGVQFLLEYLVRDRPAVIFHDQPHPAHNVLTVCTVSGRKNSQTFIKLCALWEQVTQLYFVIVVEWPSRLWVKILLDWGGCTIKWIKCDIFLFLIYWKLRAFLVEI